MAVTTINATHDVVTDDDQPATNFADGYLVTGVDTITGTVHTGTCYTWLKFSFSSLAGQTVTKVQLKVPIFWIFFDYSAFDINIRHTYTNINSATLTHNTAPSVGSVIGTIAVGTGTGTHTSTELPTYLIQNVIRTGGYIVLRLDSSGTGTAAMTQSAYGTPPQLEITHTTTVARTLAVDLAYACGASNNGTSVRGSAVSSNANEYSITTSSTITPTTINAGTNSNITFNPGPGAQVSRINTGRTYAWSKISGPTATLTNTTSNPCTLNSADGTYVIQCVYTDPYNGTVTKQQSITVVPA